MIPLVITQIGIEAVRVVEKVSFGRVFQHHGLDCGDAGLVLAELFTLADRLP